MTSNPALFEYVGFFEAEPEILSPDVGWDCGAKFTSVRGPDKFVAVIAPTDREFSFIWWRGGELVADLRMDNVVDWILETNASSETMQLHFDQHLETYFLLQLKPNISVTWRRGSGHAA